MPSNVNSPISLKRVEPGNITGDYYILLSNLPFNSTWQEMKDWVSASCPVDYVEVFPVSKSGWMRLKGKDNFMTALEHMENQPFRDRCIIIDRQNETTAVDIRVRETNSTWSRSNRRSSFARGNRDRRMTSRQIQSPNRASTPRHRRTHSVARSETDAVDLVDDAANLGNDDYLALANFMLGMSLHSTLQMQYYALPLALPYYNVGSYTSMGGVNNLPFYYGDYDQAESSFPDDDSQSSHSR